MADEQRPPNTIVIDPNPEVLAGDRLRAEIDRLQSMAAAEDAAAKAAEAAAAPPPPADESMVALLQHIILHLGNPPAAEFHFKQLRRALGK